MELIVKNADFSACGIGQAVSNDVIRMMSKYSNFANNNIALQAMQRFYSTVGAETIAKCTIIVPCFAANIAEAMKDLATDTDLRSETFDDSYYSIVANKGLIAANDASGTTIDYRIINAVNGSTSKYEGHLKLFAYMPDEQNRALSIGSDGGYIGTKSTLINANGVTSLAGLSSTGLTIGDDSNISGYRNNGILGVLDNRINGSKFSIIDDENIYSTLRTTAESSNNDFNYYKNYFCQFYSGGANTTSPISMFVWGSGITDSEAITIRNAVRQFMTYMPFN